MSLTSPVYWQWCADRFEFIAYCTFLLLLLLSQIQASSSQRRILPCVIWTFVTESRQCIVCFAQKIMNRHTQKADIQAKTGHVPEILRSSPVSFPARVPVGNRMVPTRVSPGTQVGTKWAVLRGTRAEPADKNHAGPMRCTVRVPTGPHLGMLAGTFFFSSWANVGGASGPPLRSTGYWGKCAP